LYNKARYEAAKGKQPLNIPGRTCKHCGVQLTEDNSRYTDGRKCKPCASRLVCERAKAAPEETKQKRKAYLKKYHVENFDQISARSAENRVTRRQAKKIDNPLTAAEWREIKETFNHACAYCLATDVKLTMDHIVPISKGGLHTYDNVIPACKSCNCSKKASGILRMINPNVPF